MDIRLTEEQREILSGRICPYCHVPTEYKNSIEVYGVDYGMIYYCPQCGAYVGVHKGTDRAKGRLANAVAKRVEVVKAADVFDEREIELIRRTVRPVVKECYKNAHLLTLLFPDRVQYVEGKTNVFIPIDHAFNRVGNKYIDITFEFALGFLDPTQYEYVAFGEYPAGVIEEITDQTGYYGDIYRFCYCAAQMALEKMNPRT